MQPPLACADALAPPPPYPAVRRGGLLGVLRPPVEFLPACHVYHLSHRLRVAACEGFLARLRGLVLLFVCPAAPESQICAPCSAQAGLSRETSLRSYLKNTFKPGAFAEKIDPSKRARAPALSGPMCLKPRQAWRPPPSLAGETTQWPLSCPAATACPRPLRRGCPGPQTRRTPLSRRDQSQRPSRRPRRPQRPPPHRQSRQRRRPQQRRRRCLPHPRWHRQRRHRQQRRRRCLPHPRRHRQRRPQHLHRPALAAAPIPAAALRPGSQNWPRHRRPTLAHSRAWAGPGTRPASAPRRPPPRTAPR
mmetsp:Transcript_21796/g.82908  ORF Transcript_21796/g.82908 Transcript_21796/m.82908 type:complete len:305 (-) Transcript_21796:1353-2267(-)